MSPTPEQVKALGASLREIDPSSLQPDDDGSQVRWWLGDNGTELFAWAHAGEAPHHLQLVFSRVSVEWSAARGLVTGSFGAGATSSGGRYDPYVMAEASGVDRGVCAVALALLEASTVAPALLQPLVQQLNLALR
jgi:hypothetical protein